MKYIIVLLISSAVFYSCKNDAQDTDTETKDTLVDNENQSINDVETDTIKVEEKPLVDNTPEKSSKEIIEQKYGKQWNFCDCIRANDSINKAMASDDTDENDFDLLVDRLDFVSKKCREILVVPNTTVEEREAHKAKVKKCLN